MRSVADPRNVCMRRRRAPQRDGGRARAELQDDLRVLRVVVCRAGHQQRLALLVQEHLTRARAGPCQTPRLLERRTAAAPSAFCFSEPWAPGSPGPNNSI